MVMEIRGSFRSAGSAVPARSRAELFAKVTLFAAIGLHLSGPSVDRSTIRPLDLSAAAG
jgi:hypothetical protein